MKSIEYNDNGTLKRVEFYTPADKFVPLMQYTGACGYVGNLPQYGARW